MLMRYDFAVCVTVILFFVSSCGTVSVEDSDGAPRKAVDVSNIPDPVPKSEPRSRYGNPESYEVFGKRYYVMDDSHGFVQRGIASWYGTKFHGRRTSSGETYDMYAMTAAHKTLPLPTYVEVTNLENNRRIIVKVNDRGPFHDNRIIDLSYTAASKLDIIARGTGLVEVRALDPAAYIADGGSVKDGTMPVRNAPVYGSGVKEFYIQVGAFSELLNARRLGEKLAPIGNSLVNISSAVVDGKTLYRVRLGPFIDISKADNIVSLLPQYGLYEHHVVIE